MSPDLSGELVDGPDHVNGRASPPLRQFNNSDGKHGYKRHPPIRRPSRSDQNWPISKKSCS